MIFNSTSFLFAFLPLFLILYYLLPNRLKNLCLLLGSLIFYAVGVRRQFWMFPLLLLSVLVNAAVGSRISQSLLPRNRKRWLLRGIVWNLLWLLFFKYAGVFASLLTPLAALLKQGHPTLAATLSEPLPLPLGISFYTFAALSYLIDVYRREIRWERSLPRFATWFCMFPQLISGPITRFQALRPALLRRSVNAARLEAGLREFTIGLGLKVLLADRIGGLWAAVGSIGYDSLSTLLAWLGIFAYSLQLYFDFYGYSLMAKGLGCALGFDLPDNFCYPYTAVSMTEFWRKWHMTLGAWFRDYVYIPLGGSRKGQGATFRNLLLVWLLTGIWHGATGHFLLWGLVLFLLISLEKLGLLQLFNRCRPLGHLYMLFAIPLTWLLFAAPSLPQIGIYLQRLFPFLASTPLQYFAGDFLKYLQQYGVVLLTGFVFMTPLPRRLYERWKNHPAAALLLLLIFWLSVRGILLGANDPFLYFKF